MILHSRVILAQACVFRLNQTNGLRQQQFGNNYVQFLSVSARSRQFVALSLSLSPSLFVDLTVHLLSAVSVVDVAVTKTLPVFSEACSVW